MKVAVIGAGSWGTAVSSMLAASGNQVSLWARKPEVARAINEAHVNPRYLTEFTLPDEVTGTTDPAVAIEDASAIVLATPSAAIRETSQMIAPWVDEVPVIVLSKGIERQTGCHMTQVVAQEIGRGGQLAVLSGPNHAEEVIRGIPSATVIASADDEVATFFQSLFTTSRFRVYTSRDVVGVEICAAAKNIVAIASGAGDGLGFGDNTRATTITRGLAEIRRLVRALGGEELTCMGLAGMGDLIATCTSLHSRNRLLGEMIAQGKTIDDFTEKTHMVAEGAYACLSVSELASANDIELPITQAVRGVLYEGKDVEGAVRNLFARELKSEFS